MRRPTRTKTTYLFYQSRSEFSKSLKLELFQEEEDFVPKIFDPIYSAVTESLKTITNKYLADSLPSKHQ